MCHKYMTDFAQWRTNFAGPNESVICKFACIMSVFELKNNQNAIRSLKTFQKIWISRWVVELIPMEKHILNTNAMLKTKPRYIINQE